MFARRRKYEGFFEGLGRALDSLMASLKLTRSNETVGYFISYSDGCFRINGRRESPANVLILMELAQRIVARTTTPRSTHNDEEVNAIMNQFNGFVYAPLDLGFYILDHAEQLDLMWAHDKGIQEKVTPQA